MKKIVIGLTLLPIIAWSQSHDHFSHTVETTASPEAIWAIWTDVPQWKQWDDGLKDAYLNGPFSKGAKGKLIPDKGPQSKFVISELEIGKSYTFKTRIPFGWLVIRRSLAVEKNIVYFTHEVQFTGLLKKPLSNSFGKRYRSQLPIVMQKIKTLAESKS